MKAIDPRARYKILIYGARGTAGYQSATPMDAWLVVEESKWRWDAVGSEARTRKIIKW
jgi:hypothetical protein